MKRNHTWAALALPALVLAFGLLLPHAASALPGDTATHPALRDSVVQTDFDPVWKRFQEAVKKNDRKKIADMISSPFYSTGLATTLRGVVGAGHGPSFTRDEIVKFYDSLFDKSAQKTIVTTPAAMPMFDEKNTVDRYIVNIRRDTKGFQWLEFRRDATTGAWMLARMDGIKY